MKKVLILSLISICAFAEEPTREPTLDSTPATLSPDVAKLSEAFGHLIGKNLHSIGLNFDVAQVSKGLKDASEGKQSPMTEVEWIQAIAAVNEAAYKQMAQRNLAHAEEFLAKNKTAPGVTDLENGKLQYKIEKEGTGPEVDEQSAPLIRFTGKFLDGTVFASAPEEDRIDLAEDSSILIPGFKAALIGMKEGEKRIVYIHPDLGFKKVKDDHVNSLVTFEIEVVKAHSNPEEPLDALSPTTPSVKGNPEIASPFLEQKMLR